MTHHTRKELKMKLTRIAEALSEDIDALSDAEILKEANDDNLNISKIATDFRSSALSLIAQAKSQRLTHAREGLARSQKTQALRPISRPSLETIKRKIQDALVNKPSLSMAFRDLRELSDSDWLSLWDDFVESGAIKDNDDAR